MNFATIRPLSAASRTSNLHDAFAASRFKPFRLPLIVDDVITTMEMRNELTKVLKGAGTESVGAIAVARSSGQ